MKNLTEQNIAELRQAQEILNRVLPLMESKEVEHKPFPEDYVIKKGTEVIRVVHHIGHTKIGAKGISLESEKYLMCSFGNNNTKWACNSHYLAPLNPEEHPNHPKFKLSAGDYVKITQEGLSDDLTGRIVKLTESNLEDLTPFYHFKIEGDYHFYFPYQARFCTDAEIQEFEELLKPKPIPHGTLCLAAEFLDNYFLVRYSDGNGTFYSHGKSGGAGRWHHVIPFTPEMQQIVEDYIKNNQ